MRHGPHFKASEDRASTHGLNSPLSSIPHRFRATLYLVGTLLLLLIPAVSLAQNRPPSSFSQLAENARKASEENRLDDAAVLYAKALALRPRWSEGWWSLGTLEYDRDQYRKAAHAFTKLIALEPRNGTAHAMLGLCQFELHSDNSALQNLLAAENLGILKDEQLRKVAVYHLGVLQLRASKFSSAQETLSQLAADRIRTNELTTALGLAALLVRPQEMPPEGSRGYRVVNQVGDAEAALAAKDFDTARKIFSGLLEEFPKYPNLHLAYGRFLLGLNETDDAVSQFQEELKRDSQNIHCMLEIAAVRYQVDSQNGLSYAEQAVKLAPQFPLGHYLLGLLRLDTGDVAGAIPELELARKGLPREPKVYFALGNAYARVGKKIEAAEARAEFARLNARSAQAPGPGVQGENPSGLTQKELQSLEKERPNR